MIGAPKIKTVHVTWPCIFHGWFVIQGLGLATINPTVKFEVAISTHYEDMKGGTKCEKVGGSG